MAVRPPPLVSNGRRASSLRTRVPSRLGTLCQVSFPAMNAVRLQEQGTPVPCSLQLSPRTRGKGHQPLASPAALDANQSSRHTCASRPSASRKAPPGTLPYPQVGHGISQTPWLSQENVSIYGNYRPWLNCWVLDPRGIDYF